MHSSYVNGFNLLLSYPLSLIPVPRHVNPFHGRGRSLGHP